MKAESSSRSLVDLLCPSKVHEPFTLPEDRAPLLMSCEVGWINVENRLQTVALRSIFTRSPCPLASRFATYWTDTDWNADLIVCHTCCVLVGGGELRKLRRTHVAAEGRQTLGGSRPRWEMLGVRRLLALKSGFFLSFLFFFFCMFLQHITLKNTQNSKLVPPGFYKKVLIAD